MNNNQNISSELYSKWWWHDLHQCKHVHQVCDPCHGCKSPRAVLKMGAEKSILVRLRIWRTGQHNSTKYFWEYSQLPIIQTFKGNWKRFKLSQARKKIAGSKEKNCFYCTVNTLITFNCRNVKCKLKDTCTSRLYIRT